MLLTFLREYSALWDARRPARHKYVVTQHFISNSCILPFHVNAPNTQRNPPYLASRTNHSAMTPNVQCAELAAIDSLASLVCAENRLAALPQALGYRQPALAVVNAACNQISALPPGLGYASALVKLDLHGNRRVLPDLSRFLYQFPVFYTCAAHISWAWCNSNKIQRATTSLCYHSYRIKTDIPTL